MAQRIGTCPDCSCRTSRSGCRCSPCAIRKLWREGKMVRRTRPRRGRDLAEVEAAWLGAMVEGEGSVLGRKRNTRSTPIQPLVQVCNSSVEVIATCLRLVGTGCVYLRPRCRGDKDHWKPVWFWIVTARQDVLYLLDRIAPYLASKQDRAMAILDEFGEQLNTGREM